MKEINVTVEGKSPIYAAHLYSAETIQSLVHIRLLLESVSSQISTLLETGNVAEGTPAGMVSGYLQDALSMLVADGTGQPEGGRSSDTALTEATEAWPGVTVTAYWWSSPCDPELRATYAGLAADILRAGVIRPDWIAPTRERRKLDGLPVRVRRRFRADGRLWLTVGIRASRKAAGAAWDMSNAGHLLPCPELVRAAIRDFEHRHSARAASGLKAAAGRGSPRGRLEAALGAERPALHLVVDNTRNRVTRS